MSSGVGWSGVESAVLNFLRVVGADRELDKDGKPTGPFLLSGDEGSGVFSFLGMTGPGADVVIPSDVVYFVNGKPSNLALGLGNTSQGLSVYVIA